jgi:methionyl-tRNA formyltransferase
MDAGDILLKSAIPIGGLVDGELRRKLAELAADLLAPFLNMCMNGEISGTPQKMDEGTYFPKVTSKEGVILLRSGGFPKESMERGLTPYPGLSFLERCFDELQK